MQHTIKVIGVGGVARAGKDTFVSILINQLRQLDLSAKRIALADPLKKYCDGFLTENLGVSAYTQIPEEKLLIRPFLVWFGDAKRKQTNGRFWIELANSEVNKAEKEGYDYAIISDVRYAHYEKDEVHWVTTERDGILCHISQVLTPISTQNNPTVFVVPPANEHELINDPKVRVAASHQILWERVNDTDVLHNPYLNQHVSDFIHRHLHRHRSFQNETP